jgi:hypothetical protein
MLKNEKKNKNVVRQVIYCHKMRGLSEKFMSDLGPDGLLYPILARVKQDDTLMLAIRENYINIYYRGGNILKISVPKQGNGFYNSSFDAEYDKSGTVHGPTSHIKSQNDAKAWVEEFPHLKEAMDHYFSKHRKPEREFQQLVARENNFSPISNESEYFVSDIEFADLGLGARFDMLAIRWLASHRKDGSKCRAALIEMKYGDRALGNQKYDSDCDDKAGLLKHLQDINAFIKDTVRYKSLLSIMETQFNQLDQLGLLHFNHCKNETKVQLNAKANPEVIFMLANHNPRSSKLKTILSGSDFDKYKQLRYFDLKFHVASFSGYGLYSDCMLDLDEFRKRLPGTPCQ